MDSLNGIIVTLMLLITANSNVINSEDAKMPLLTQTVYGFLDFTTTMGNTVMVFSPQSAPALVLPNIIPTPQPIIKTKPINKDVKEAKEMEGTNINPTKSEFESKSKTAVGAVNASTTTTYTAVNNLERNATTSITLKTPKGIDDTTTARYTNKTIPPAAAVINNVIIKAESDATAAAPTTQSPTTPLPIKNDLHSPEYNLLSRQPPQFVEESYRVVNLKQSPPPSAQASSPASFNKNIRSNGAVVVTPEKNTATSVVVAASTATTTTTAAKNSANRSHKSNKKHSKLRPSGTLQVLKTAAPALNEKSSSSSGARHSSSSTSRKNGKKGSHRSTTQTTSKALGETVTARPPNTRTKPKRRKNKNKNPSQGAKPKYERTTTTAVQETTTRRVFRPKTPNHYITDLENNYNNNNNNYNNNNNNNLHITKLNRAPGRWQYKTTPKPRVTIRKPLVESAGNVAGPLGLTNVSLISAVTESLFNDNISNNFIISNQSDLESSGSQNGGAIVNNIDSDKNGIGIDGKQQKFFTETINVEISTPADFKDTYYEIATIKKPFIVQAGILKKTRYITVTSTLEKYLATDIVQEPHTEDGPLTENILATTSQPENFLTGSISTLNPIFVDNEADTPILETVTDTFSIVHKKIKTQILPFIKVGIENETSYHTLMQTIDLTSLITVTKTISPLMESKYFNDFKDFVGNLDEAGSELNLDLEYGDETNNHENGNADGMKKLKHLDNQLDQLLIGKDNRTIITSPLSPSSHSPPSILLSSTANIPNFLQHTLPTLATVITNSRPVINLETLWESYVIPITNGQSTTFRTLSKAKGIVEKTDYVLETTTLPISQPPLLPPSTINPFLLPQQQQQYQTITSPIIQQTIATQTQSKVLKLTFGAKTAYTTLYSTQVVPTLQTLYVTTSIPVQHTANPFPGFFPPAYNPFAYLG